MRLTIGDHVSFATGFFIQLAAAVLLLPVNWVFGWLVAAAFHEFCHYCALRLCGVQVYAIRVSHTGAFMETECMRPCHEMISSVAGPVGSLLLLILLRIFPEVAISALLQSIFNLLPIYPFDGGRALRVLLMLVLSREVADVVFRYIQIFIIIAIIIISILVSYFLNYWLFSIGMCLLLFNKKIPIKIPCKQIKQIVQ